MRSEHWIAKNGLAAAGDGPPQIVSLVGLSDDDRKLLAAEANIDAHTLDSALDPDELSRLELDQDWAAVIYKCPGPGWSVESAGAVLTAGRLWVVAPDRDPLAGVRGRVTSPAAAVLRMVASATAGFRERLRAVQRESEELQSKINLALENRHLIAMFELERALVYYVSALGCNESLLERMRHSAAKLGLSSEEETELLEDVEIENRQCLRQAEMQSNIIAGLMDARASIVANNLNRMMKTLSVVAVSIMAPTLVVSLFSMNVPLPLGADSSPRSFWVVVATAAVAAMALLIPWLRRGGR